MIFITLFYETPLYIAIENDNTEIVRLLLSHENINVNLTAILFILLNKVFTIKIYIIPRHFFLITFFAKCFYSILD